MKRIHLILLLATLLLLPLTTQAYWYTAVDSLTPVAVAPDTGEIYNQVLPFTDGSTLVVMGKGGVGQCYQVIDRFGECWFDLPKPLTNTYTESLINPTMLSSDGQGGAVVGWRQLNHGLVAQRLDSLGNLLWGDEGVLAYPDTPTNWSCCSDGTGGMFFAYSIPEPSFDTGDTWIQRILSDGSLPWGSTGLPLITVPNAGSGDPVLCSDGADGAFIIFIDERNTPWGELFAQHFDGSGQALWPEDLLITGGQPATHDLFPDGYNGVIMFVGGAGWNDAYRYNADGEQVWMRPNVSQVGEMVPGEPGFWYIGHGGGNQVYAQRIDVNGNFYWPPFYPGLGALMWERPGFVPSGFRSFRFRDGRFAVIVACHPSGEYDYSFLVQALDTLGNQLIQPDAALIYVAYQAELQMPEVVNIIPSNNGLTAIFDIDSTVGNDNIYAKHLFWDGSLGGPIPLEVVLTPETTPIQIPSTGGNFHYDIAIADTTPVGGSFDAWIEVILPNGSTLEILSRIGLTISSGETINRPNVTQSVPAGAPAGIFTYNLYVGQHDCDYSWVQDSFMFYKLLPGTLPVNYDVEDGLALNPPLPPLNKGDKMQHPPYQGGRLAAGGAGGSEQATVGISIMSGSGTIPTTG